MKTMLLGIDGNEANVQDRVGSNVYAYEMLKNIHSLITQDPKLQASLNIRVYLKNPPIADFPTPNANWNYNFFGPSPLWTQWRLPLELYREKYAEIAPKLYFTPGHYAPRFSPVPTVVSIMDLAYLKFPQEFRQKDLKKLTNWTAYSVRNASHIFAISESTKKDIIENYNIEPDKITVTYLGFSKQAATTKTKTDRDFEQLKKDYLVDDNYLIYVGTLQPRKNIAKLIDAYFELKKTAQHQNLQLVIVGKKGWLYEEIFQKVKNLKLDNYVIFTGFVSEYEKHQLLQNARAYVLPSLYEGFGIPVLEAIEANIPVVISNNSSLPEVGGKYAFYIEDPNSAVQIANSIQKVLQLSHARRTEITCAAKAWITKFNWQKCANQTLSKLLEVTETL